VDGNGFGSFDEARLIAEAERETGLSDWGGARFRRPFGILVRALNEEAGLNPIGRERARQWLALRLSQRLRMIEDRKRRPEIAAQTIDRPVFLVGFPRAGTTYLHTLLSLDPGNISPLYWQINRPSPPPNDPAIDHRAAIEDADALLESQGWTAPEFQGAHRLTAELPEEDYLAFEYSFVSTGFMGFFDVPSYVAEVIAGDFLPAYEWHKRVLQALQIGTQGRRWMLKAPEHTLHIPTLLEIYPDALFVHHHRDPAKVMASVFKLLSVCRSFYSDRPQGMTPAQARGFMQMYAKGIENMIQLRDDLALNARFLDIQYLDLERKPLACVRRVFEHSGLAFTPDAQAKVAAWIGDNRKGKHGKHQYLLADYGLHEDEVREAFAAYMDRFDVEKEAAA
jgi:hypothetical protein